MGSSMLKDFEEVKIAQFDFSIFSESLRYLHIANAIRILLGEGGGHYYGRTGGMLLLKVI
jgi:hypothetical protein